MAAAAAVFAAVLVGIEAAGRRWALAPETTRKSAHVICAAVTALLPLVVPFRAVVGVALLYVPSMVLSRRFDLLPSIHRVERTTLGEMWFPLGVAIAALAFPQRLAFAYGMLVMGVSDAAASVAGQRYGVRHYQVLGGPKTLVGSAVFVATTAVLTAGALALAGSPSPPAAVGALATFPLVLAALEGTLGGGVDNLVLPIAAAGLLALVTS